MNAEARIDVDRAHDEIAMITEGLAYAIRPINEGAREFTKRLGLGPRGAFMLTLIERGVAYPADLASALRTQRSLITADLQRLKDAGLVSATNGDADKRRTRLALTEEGRAARQAISDGIDCIVRSNLVAYTPEELDLFARMLRDVRGPDDSGEPMRVKPVVSDF